MSEAHYRVLSPGGRRAAQTRPSSATLTSLDGKTIGQLWNYMFRGDEIFSMARSGVTSRYPNVRFVDYADFGRIHGPDEDVVIAALPRMLQEKGCEAVMCGVGA